MSKIIDSDLPTPDPAHDQTRAEAPLSPEEQLAEVEQALQNSEEFIRNNQGMISSLSGLQGVSIQVGPGFATDMKTGAVYVDPSFFIEKGYRPEWCTYGVLHELTAHLHEILTRPKLSKEKTEFYEKSPAHHVFINSIDDVAGNRRIHAFLPSMADVADKVYKEKLFVDDDQTTQPKSMQFLNEIIRSAMIKKDQTIVDDDVRQALDGLRNYGPDGRDMIDYCTNPRYDAAKRFKAAKKFLWPVYEALLEIDKQNEQEQQQGGEGEGDGQPQSGDSNSQPNSGAQPNSMTKTVEDPNQKSDDNKSNPDGQKGEDDKDGDDDSNGADGDKKAGDPEQDSSNGGGDGENGDQENGADKKGKKPKKSLDDAHKEYWDNHAEPLTHEELDEMVDEIKNQGKADEVDEDELEKQANNPPGPPAPAGGKGFGRGASSALDGDKAAIKALEAIAGTSAGEVMKYRRELEKFWPQIEDMVDFYEQLIARRIAEVATLTTNHKTGAFINPSQLAQAHIEIIGGNLEPSVMLKIERESRMTRAVGGFDIYIETDCSGSMGGNKSYQAAAVNMIFGEGLDIAQQKIEEAEQDLGVDLGLDVRTEFGVFGNISKVIKELSPHLEEKDRHKIYSQTQVDLGGTGDYLSLERIYDEIIAQPYDERMRDKLVIVITDGISGIPARAKIAIDALRELDVMVMAISIGDKQAETLYHPNGKYIASPDQLPEVASTLLKNYITQRTR